MNNKNTHLDEPMTIKKRQELIQFVKNSVDMKNSYNAIISSTSKEVLADGDIKKIDSYLSSAASLAEKLRIIEVAKACCAVINDVNLGEIVYESITEDKGYDDFPHLKKKGVKEYKFKENKKIFLQSLNYVLTRGWLAT